MNTHKDKKKEIPYKNSEEQWGHKEKPKNSA